MRTYLFKITYQNGTFTLVKMSQNEADVMALKSHIESVQLVP